MYHSVKLWRVIWWQFSAPLRCDAIAQLCMDFVPNFVSTTLLRSAGMNCRAHTFSSSFFALLFLAKSVYSESSCIFLWTACPQWNPQPQPQQAVINSRHHNLLYFCRNLFVIKYKLMTEVVVTLPWRRQLRTLENLNTGRVYSRQSINIIIFIFIQLYWHHSLYFPCAWFKAHISGHHQPAVEHSWIIMFWKSFSSRLYITVLRDCRRLLFITF